MKEITWTSDLSVGIELIDGQHKMLIKHLNDLSQSLESGEGPAKIATTLNFLIDYTNFHFTAEEKHMAIIVIQNWKIIKKCMKVSRQP